MNKQLAVVLLLACLVGLAAGRSLSESSDVKEGMKDAYARGIDRFGQRINTKRSEEPADAAPADGPKKPFSLYSQGINALGGGKPALADQYRQHSYKPLAPVVVPQAHEISDKITAGEAAKLYVPHAPLQFTTDRLRVV